MKSTIELSPGFPCEYPIRFTSFTFPGGEVHVKIVGVPTSNVMINARCNNSEDFMRIVMTVDALRGMGVSDIGLFIPYMPYARQDRRMVSGEPFSLRMFGSMLNELGLYVVSTYDIHSDVSRGIIDNLQCINNYNEVFDFARTLENYTLVSPDVGAHKKIHNLAAVLGYKDEIVMANKCRDVTNGKIIKTDVYGDVAGKNCLIVDDICDGGATFIELARVLRSRGAGKLYLFVSHGIFSKGTEALCAYYDEIATTNSIRESTPHVDTYPITNFQYKRGESE